MCCSMGCIEGGSSQEESKSYDITMSAILHSLQALRFPRVLMSAECPNFRLENKNNMATQNILFKKKKEEEESFLLPFLPRSLPLFMNNLV